MYILSIFNKRTQVTDSDSLESRCNRRMRSWIALHALSSDPIRQGHYALAGLIVPHDANALLDVTADVL